MNTGVPQRNYTVVEIPKNLHKKLKPYAVERGQSVKAIVIEAISEFLNRAKQSVKNNVTQAAK